MAVIGKIRQRTGLLLGIIGVSLVMFLLMDALQNGIRMGSAGKQNVGKINGKKISQKDFALRVEEYVNRLKIMRPDIELNDQTYAAIREEVWNNIAMDNIMGRSLDDLGLVVSNAEIADAEAGNNPHPFARQIFVNPQTRQYDKNLASQTLLNMAQQPQEVKDAIKVLEDVIVEDRLKTKYAALISKSYNIPTFYAKEALRANTESLKATIYALPYTSIADNTIKIEESDLKKYMDAHAKDFELKEETRDIEFVTFPIIPTKGDSAEAYKAISDRFTEFSGLSNDTVFRKSRTTRGLDDAYYTQEDFEKSQLTNFDQLMSTNEGTVIAPYIRNGSYVITKVMGKRMLSDSVRASHILLKVDPNSKDSYDRMNKLADALIDSAKTGKESFPNLAYKHSTDEGSRVQGGNLGFFPRGAMVKPFNDKVFYEMNLGDIVKVESQFGIHVIWLTGINPKTPAVKFADVEIPIQASKETEDAAYSAAMNFMQKSSTSETFAKNAKTKNLQTSYGLEKNQAAVNALGEAREIVNWVFNQKKPGAVTNFDLGDKIAIVHFAKINPKGMQPLENVKGEVEDLVRKEKKGALLVEKLQKAGGNFETIPNIIKLDSAQLLFANDKVDSLGEEPKLVALAFATKPGATSKPMAGERNAFVVKTGSINKDQGMDLPLDFIKQQLGMQAAQNFQFQNIISSVIKNAKVEDTRYKFY